MGLKIAVLVKQVPDHEAIVRLGPDGKLDIENRYVCSFFDEIAVEQALAVKKEHPQAEILALSAGGRRAVEALRRAIAMGIDQVEQIGDERLESADSTYIASLLAARLKVFAPHLVLCGKQAGDDDLGAVGPMVAEFLGCSHASAIVSLKLDPNSSTAEVGRKVEGGVWALKAGLPLVVSAEKGLIEPHLPVVTRVMKAMKAKIPAIPAAELDLVEVTPEGRLIRIGFEPPPSRPPVTMVEDVAALVQKLKSSGAIG
jgi:electron transfer flavoprotein beta subunit